MKRYFTLILVFLTAFTFKGMAQNTCQVHAAFNHETSAISWNLVHFINLSTVSPGTVLSSHWTFGDGSLSSDFSPSHLYANPGTYNVCLKVTGNAGCVDSTCSTVIVTAPLACTLHAGFIHQAASGSPNQIYFSNTSTPLSDVHETHWNFGDGTGASTTSAYHTYANAGTYLVCLKVRRDNLCADSTCQTIVITFPTSCNIHAKFSYHRDSVQTNKIYFTNLSTPLNDIHYTKWIFGDGTFSYDFNATHTYSASGLYHVCLIVKKDSSCQRDTCMDIQVQLPPPPPSCNLVANFIWTPDSILVNKIHFTNLSVPLSPTDSIRWTFGDGTISHEVNPIHVFTAPGIYNVCLRVKKNNTNGGTSFCVKEICKTVIVQAACVISANFSSHSDSANTLKVYLTNLSTPASTITNVQWTFGDGTTSSSWSPDHIYAHAGNYNVCLHVSSGVGCYSSICKEVVVIEPINCLEISKFTFTSSTANCLEFHFQPLHINSAWHYQWTFGDGTSSTLIAPGHGYAQPGNYTVCLTVVRSISCASTTCKPLSTGLCFSCNNVWVKFTYTRDPSMPNKLHFHGQSNYPITTETWTFARISPLSTAPPVVLHEFDPTYVFPEPGYYRVCLHAVTYGGCIKEYCEVIYIGQIGGTCILQAYPNPAHVTVSVNVVESAPEVIHVYVYNAMNILVKQQDQPGSIGNNIVTLNIESLIAGAYTMRIVYGNHVCYAPFQKI